MFQTCQIGRKILLQNCFKAGIAKADSTGALSVQESSLQPMVYLDRLTEGQIEKLPELIRILPELKNLLEK